MLVTAGCLLCSAEAHAARLRLGVGNSLVSFTKISTDGTVSGSAPIGLGLWAGYFLGDRLSADGSFELNLAKDKSGGKFTTVFLGGSAAMSFYLTGGPPKEVRLESLNVESLPRFNTNVFLGLGGASYNFNAFDASTGKVVKRAANNTLRGSTMGFVFGSGLSLGIKENIYINFVGKLFKGLPDEITPEIRKLVLGGGIEVML